MSVKRKTKKDFTLSWLLLFLLQCTVSNDCFYKLSLATPCIVAGYFLLFFKVRGLEPLGLCVKKTIRWIVFSTRRLAGTEICKNLGRQANSMRGVAVAYCQVLPPQPNQIPLLIQLVLIVVSLFYIVFKPLKRIKRCIWGAYIPFCNVLFIRYKNR